MRRFPWLVGFGVWGALALGGCTPTGSYQLSWNFFARADGTGDIESAADGCGRHGVDGILLTGTSGGAGATRAALCTPGQASGTVAPGSWTFQIQTIDVRGTVLPGSVSTATMTVSEGMTAMFPPVTLTPRPECSDGIDNDGDGLVDGDDPGCANATVTTTESTPGVPPPDGGSPDGGVSDGAVPDGAAVDGAATDGPGQDGPGTDALPADGLAPEAGPTEGGTSEGGTPDGGTADDGGSDAPAPVDAATGG